MFYPSQFETLADEVSKITDSGLTGQYKMEFTLPGSVPGKIEYVPQGVDQNSHPCGTALIYWGNEFENKTEVDSLHNAIDAIDGLVSEYKNKYDAERAYGDSIDTAMMDHYDMMNGDIGDFESVGNTDKQTITESVNDDIVLVENFPVWALEPMVNGTWGDWVTYYGEKLARDDFKKIDSFMTSKGLCDIIPPSDDEYQNTYREFDTCPAFGEATSTVTAYGRKGTWSSLVDEYDLAEEESDPEIDLNSVKDTKAPVMETTEEIINAPDDVIEIDPAAMTSDSDPLVEYLKGLESFNGWDPADIQIWARDNHDAIQEYYNQCKSLDQAIQMCIDAEKDKFYQEFNKYESVRGANQKVFCEAVTKLCEKAGHPELGAAVVKLMEAIESTECTGDCVQLGDAPNFDVTIAVDTMDPNPAHYQVEGYDANDALEKVAEDLKAKGHLGYFEENPTYPEDYFEVAGTFIPSWLVNIEKIA